MAAAFTIEIKGIDTIAKGFNEMPEKAKREISQEFQAIALEWAGSAKKDAPADTGRLRGSISETHGQLSFAVIAQAAYAAYQEWGTKGNVNVSPSLQSYAIQFKTSKNNKGGLKPHSYLFSDKGSPGSGNKLDYFVMKIKTNVAAVLQDLLKQ